MKPRKLSLLGSTGSIGRSCLDVIKAHPGQFQIKALVAYSNVELLVEQYRQFRPEYLCLVDESKSKQLAAAVAGEPVRILIGADAVVSLAGLPDVDLVVNAIVGAAGLRASLEAVTHHIPLALANKESLVAGGPIFRPLIESGQARILPIDSEHSAIWQSLLAGKREEVRNLILTASGGPFRELPIEQFKGITVEQALCHPTWNMGPKITIDSATMLNKGLEIIEAVTLFGVSASKIKVVIHPQSVVHSMVEFVDSSVIAQLSRPDMRLPISYALFWPDRVNSEFGRLDWSQVMNLTFDRPDFERFPLLRLAYEVAGTGSTHPAVYNAANEIAVEAFLNRAIGFTDIYEVVSATVATLAPIADPTIADILAADSEARTIARKSLETVRC
ncbi:MAG: 1-deoxy-D-xylulose-5-phosphate reductoisomerase [bacterium]|nr:1-deoxy-D-xylulose-5-phosphate reductoisomerase [bacterium]